MELSSTSSFSEPIKIKLDKGAYYPQRAHEDDAGYDLRTPVPISIGAFNPMNGPGKAIIDTGVHIEIPKGYVGFLKSKSGLNVKHNIIGEGVVDAGYNGSIHVKLYNLGEEEHHFDAGDKIIQLVILPIATPDLEVVDELSETERGENGFGSTGV